MLTPGAVLDMFQLEKDARKKEDEVDGEQNNNDID